MPSAKRSDKRARSAVVLKRTIRMSEWQRLSFCNSARLPQRVWLHGELLEWVGIGWIEIDPADADGSEPTVVDD